MVRGQQQRLRLVVLVTGDYMHAGVDGITITSDSFASVVPWFSYVLSIAVILFALSTLITWSYYGLQAWKFLFGKSHVADLIYKLIFCGVAVIATSVAMAGSYYVVARRPWPNGTC